MPKVSVIIPAYQCELFIKETLDSIFSQTYKDFEVIVVNDGSSDNTAQILLDYQPKQNLFVFEQSNLGPSAARNNGIKRCSGEYIAFIDADDLWLPDKLEKQVAILEQNPETILVYSDTFFFDINKWKDTSFDFAPPYKGMIFEQLFVNNFIPLLTVLIRRNTLDKVGLFDEEIIGPEDYDLWLRSSQFGKVDFINEPLAVYRINFGQLSKKKLRMIQNILRVKSKFVTREYGNFILSKKILDLGYYRLLLRESRYLLQENQRKEGQKALNQYIKVRGLTFQSILLSVLFVLPNFIRNPLNKIWEKTRPTYRFDF